ALVTVEVRNIIFKVGFENIQQAIPVVVTDGKPHAGLDKAVRIKGNSTFQPDFAERTVAIVVVKQARRGVAGHIDIGPAAILKICRDRRKTVAAATCLNTRPYRNIAESAIAIVVIKLILCRWQTSRATKYRDTFPSTMRIAARER